MAAVDNIVIRAARQHNLQGIDLDLPRNKMIVITGLSGSGKSSLAFDTIFAEGQRRYVESLSAYSRQHLARLARPDVDTIEGLSPTISVEQRVVNRSPRSTVGTVTDIHDYLRLLFARIGQPVCPTCGESIRAHTVEQMIDEVLSLPEKSRLMILAPVVRDEKGSFAARLAEYSSRGFVRAEIDGVLHDLSVPPKLLGSQRHTISLVVDRIILKQGIRSRLSESIELAVELGQGLVRIAGSAQGDEAKAFERLFSNQPLCHDCGTLLPEPTPQLFSFNNPQGACSTCAGLGVLMEFSEHRIVPDESRSLKEGAIEPWEMRNAFHQQQVIDALAKHYGFDPFCAYSDLPQSIRTMLMHGSGDEEIAFCIRRGGEERNFRRPFEGVIANLRRRLDDTRKRGARIADEESSFDDVEGYLTRRTCPTCAGTRLRAEARSVKVSGCSISQLCALSIVQIIDRLETLPLTVREQKIIGHVMSEIRSRLGFLRDVGLDYLSLDRATPTLSGGEAQRVRLATQIGASLMGVIYVLDEPSVGLHAHDTERLLGTLQAIRDRGNTVILVEHDLAIMRAADVIVDLGPGAGRTGGNVVAAGTLEDVMGSKESLTGQVLCGRRPCLVPEKRRHGAHAIVLSGVTQNNLNGVTLRVPLGVFSCVTGVSGSGKSSLVMDALLPTLRGELHGASVGPVPIKGITGHRRIDRVIAIDHSPIGRTPRSNAATYSEAFALIRELFAGVPASRARGYRAGRFSFNVRGGRCESCRGEGVTRIAMHFLPDVYVECEACRGQRFNSETLAILYKGLSISDVLALTVDEARDVFSSVPKLKRKMETLCDVGLGYLVLGQAANTLSGGEAQRLKLARELSRSGIGKAMYIFDEPTAGLHTVDVERLIRVFDRLVVAGNTVLVVEHHLDVIAAADHVVDLGPGGGEQGGQIIASGTPEEIARMPASLTGRALRAVLSDA